MKDPWICPEGSWYWVISEHLAEMQIKGTFEQKHKGHERKTQESCVQTIGSSERENRVVRREEKL